MAVNPLLYLEYSTILLLIGKFYYIGMFHSHEQGSQAAKSRYRSAKGKPPYVSPLAERYREDLHLGLSVAK